METILWFQRKSLIFYSNEFAKEHVFIWFPLQTYTSLALLNRSFGALGSHLP